MYAQLIASLAVLSAGMVAAESHTVTLVNNCGQGTAIMEVAGGATYTGTTTFNGPVEGGLAWIEGAYGCGSANGVNCGDVEFTLTNAAPAQNAFDYSLQQNGGQTHTWRYPMDFSVSGCSLTPYTPGPCSSASNCPGAFTGTDATDGIVYQCLANDVDVTITFC